jgi:hypothetical protein
MFSGGLVEPTITVAAEAGDFVRAPMASINRRNRNPMTVSSANRRTCTMLSGIGGPAARPMALHAAEGGNPTIG